MTEIESLIVSASAWILEEYSLFYEECLKIPELAKLVFEKCDFASSVQVSAHRLPPSSIGIAEVSESLIETYPDIPIGILRMALFFYQKY